MEKFPWMWLLVLMATVPVRAVLDLTGLQAIEGTWRAPVTLPCVYEPSADFEETSVVWKATQDGHGLRRIFERDAGSGDHILLTTFRGRLSIAKKTPGDVSLLIQELDMTDAGQYVCEVTSEARDKTRITTEWATMLKIVKVPVTKPVIMSGSMGSILPNGERTNLTCSADGSPPISYQWFKEVPGSSDELLGRTAVLEFDRLQTSDTGRYYCTAENRVSGKREQSDAVQLTVQDSTEVLTLQPESEVSTPAGRVLGPGTASLPLYIVIPIAVLCAVVVLVVASAVFCRRRRNETDNTYDVAYNNYAVTSGETFSAGPGVIGMCGFEEPNQVLSNNYTAEPTKDGVYVAMDLKTDNEYELLSHNMESEYEIGS
ncbi:V-set and immunoglobulin domain-containing protein 4 [Elgaria multicarinata webbii]|uniref:V-set and immunoglobulin domain-containing protein 4 n=1 Tax=Elgaria multicarinata webbii TaxID=159646 RepID=UPI002FCD3547